MDCVLAFVSARGTAANDSREGRGAFVEEWGKN